DQERDRGRDLEPAVSDPLDELASRDRAPDPAVGGGGGVGGAAAHAPTARRNRSARLGSTTLKVRTEPAARAASRTSSSRAPSVSSTMPPPGSVSRTVTPGSDASHPFEDPA